ncbi:MAG TPA: fibronectin type III domain-containing protein [Noviherbaspirillum sp.]|nr:fibronectin type III domain-containing protein [Noviherbaspirillum sp.]
MRPRFFAIGAILHIAAGTAAAQTNDVLTWMHSQLPANQYIGVDAEYKSGGVWISRTSTYQPFKSSVNYAAKQAYWRKDAIDLSRTWYGELFYYDSNYIYLHSETFPVMPPYSNIWDERIDRFRLFKNASNSSMGRVIAPRTVTSGWSYSQTLNTYMCGVSNVSGSYSQVDGFQQVNAGTCPGYQAGVSDTAVTATIVSNYDVLEGEAVAGNAPAAAPSGSTEVASIRYFEKALIIEQVMFNSARERFIFGYNQGTYYGIVRWDNSTGSPGNWTVTDRTIGIRVLARNSGNFDFAGMAKRGQWDRTLRPAKPNGLAASCVANSNQLQLSWNDVPGATGFNIRVDDLVDGWIPGGTYDLVVNGHAGKSFIFPTVPGHQYNWWVHAVNGAGESDATGASVVAGSCSGSASSIPPQPQNLSVSLAGDMATLSWSPAYSATGYDIRVNDMSDGGWTPGVGNDIAPNSHKSNSYIFRIIPGRTYQWWIHSANSLGSSNATGGSNFSYIAP